MERTYRQTMIWITVLILSITLLLWQVAGALAYVAEWPASVVGSGARSSASLTV